MGEVMRGTRYEGVTQGVSGVFCLPLASIGLSSLLSPQSV